MPSLNQLAEPANVSEVDLAEDADEAFWDGADVIWPKPKERVTVRFDRDVLDYFRREGKGYQTRMNAVLRAYIAAHREPR
jgi:uncharacterized protein (DUF4415 family)